MKSIYSLLVQLTWYALHIIALLNPKIKNFISGRKTSFAKLKSSVSQTDKVIWMHVASLGEYEQGLPLLEKLKERYTQYKLVLTFFSPSGYEIKKDKSPADVVVYLPMDTRANAKKFLKIVHPKIAIFIKYEIWPNYLSVLKHSSTPTFLVSGIFSKKQAFFKWYGGFMRESLKGFTHFFVQEEHSKSLLQNLKLNNVTVSGDTRFDRVSEILNQDNTLDFMDDFKGSSKLLVAGSTWPEDEDVILDFINNSNLNLKFVIAPHNIKNKTIEELKAAIGKKTVLFSKKEKKLLKNAQILIIDTIGLLTKIYSYADIAYVGGGFATGLHNTLEPAVFGVPIIIGPQYKKFNEAIEMVNNGGLIVIHDKMSFSKSLQDLQQSNTQTKILGAKNAAYVTQNIGATQTVLQYLNKLL